MRHARLVARPDASRVEVDSRSASNPSVRHQVDRGTHRLVNQEIRQDGPRYRTIEIRAGRQTITAADPVPDDLRQVLDAINRLNWLAH